MKIALVQLNYHIGNFSSNITKIISHIEKAKSEGAHLVVFSELAVCGYYPHDLLERMEFIENTQKAVDEIVGSTSNIAVVIGAPTVNNSKN